MTTRWLRRTATGTWIARTSAVGLLGLAAIVFGACGPDCTGPGGLVSHDQTQSAVTLTAAHPAAEQAVTVRFSEKALPADATESVTLVVRSAQSARAPSVAPTPSIDVSRPPSGVVEVSLIDAATGRVSSTASVDGGQYAVGAPGALIVTTIDCPRGAACEHDLQLRVAAPWLSGEAEVPFAWEVVTNVRYEGFAETCGVPKGATSDVEVGTPELVPAAAVAFARPLDVITEPAAALTTRHVTVETNQAPASGASMRIGVAGLATVPTLTWVRVIPDAAESGVGTQPVSDQLMPGLPATIDAPVLVDCPAEGPCRRGYWVVFQTFVQSISPMIPAPDAPPPDVGRLAWTASAIAPAAPRSGGRTRTLAITVDETRPGSWLAAIVSAAAAPVELRESDIPVVIEAVITVPERPEPDVALDRLAATVAIVHVGGERSGQWARLEGDGAGPLVAYNSGSAIHSLVAHPLDACPVSGPCTATLRLIGWTTERRPARAAPSTVDWSIDLLGAPPGTAVRFGEPREVRPLPWVLVGGAVFVAAVLMVLAMRLRRRRRARRPAG